MVHLSSIPFSTTSFTILFSITFITWGSFVTTSNATLPSPIGTLRSVLLVVLLLVSQSARSLGLVSLLGPSLGLVSLLGPSLGLVSLLAPSLGPVSQLASPLGLGLMLAFAYRNIFFHQTFALWDNQDRLFSHQQLVHTVHIDTFSKLMSAELLLQVAALQRDCQNAI